MFLFNYIIRKRDFSKFTLGAAVPKPLKSAPHPASPSQDTEDQPLESSGGRHWAPAVEESPGAKSRWPQRHSGGLVVGNCDFTAANQEAGLLQIGKTEGVFVTATHLDTGFY